MDDIVLLKIKSYLRLNLISKSSVNDYFSQPAKLFQLMSEEQQQALFSNTARAMGDTPKEIKMRHIGNCLKADPAYGKGVAEAVGISLDEFPQY